MRIRVISIISLISLFLLSCGCQFGHPAIDVSDIPSADIISGADGQSADSVYQLAEGLSIVEVFSFSGTFVEDGSNDPCKNVMAVRIENHSDVHYSYIRFELETAEHVYHFSASTVLGGTNITVLDADREEFDGKRILSKNITAIAPFLETPSVHMESVKITYLDGILNVKNLTDSPLKGVYVYYKNTDDYGFFGGITYRSYFEVIESGEIKQNSVANLHKDSSTIMFVTFE